VQAVTRCWQTFRLRLREAEQNRLPRSGYGEKRRQHAGAQAQNKQQAVAQSTTPVNAPSVRHVPIMPTLTRRVPAITIQRLKATVKLSIPVTAAARRLIWRRDKPAPPNARQHSAKPPATRSHIKNQRPATVSVFTLAPNARRAVPSRLPRQHCQSSIQTTMPTQNRSPATASCRHSGNRTPRHAVRGV